MDFVGKWHIYQMEMWDEDYFNMATQAFIEIKKNRTGSFQFGLVRGDIDGENAKTGAKSRFEFTWEGDDEGTPVSGSGWLEFLDEDNLNGRIKFHSGDSSKFKASRAE